MEVTSPIMEPGLVTALYNDEGCVRPVGDTMLEVERNIQLARHPLKLGNRCKVLSQLGYGLMTRYENKSQSSNK